MRVLVSVYTFVSAIVLSVGAWAAGGTVVVPLGGDTYRAAVPKTGQSLCYDVTSPGTAIPCADTGQDGEYQMGVAWPSPRFTDLGDGTVRDNMSRLIWLQNADCRGTQPLSPGGKMNIADAYDYVAALNKGQIKGNCGDQGMKDDWRIPNRFELESLLDLGEVGPALPVGHPFNNARSSYYWSSSYDSFFGPSFGNRWAVHFSAGKVETLSGLYDPKIPKDERGYLWLVRGGYNQ